MLIEGAGKSSAKGSSKSISEASSESAEAASTAISTAIDDVQVELYRPLLFHVDCIVLCHVPHRRNPLGLHALVLLTSIGQAFIPFCVGVMGARAASCRIVVMQHELGSWGALTHHRQVD